MYPPSEEIWESFGALWRRIEQLSRQMRDLEARLTAVEDAKVGEVGGAFKAEANVPEKLGGTIPFEGEIHR